MSYPLSRTRSDKVYVYSKTRFTGMSHWTVDIDALGTDECGDDAKTGWSIRDERWPKLSVGSHYKTKMTENGDSIVVKVNNVDGERGINSAS